ncbi:hypothetical protein D7B12_18130 [Salmonella enterica]|nr:hypothetical protein [Salmonella enterica]
MLSLEQITHFQNCFTRAKKIICTPVDTSKRFPATAYHIRVSGRKAPNGKSAIGFIFGTKGNADWLQIATVPDEDLPRVKKIYRAMLHDLINVS